MGLNRKYRIPRTLVKDARGEELGEVRGLNFQDITAFLNKHFDNFDKLITMWDHYQDLAKERDADAIMSDGVLIQFCSDLVMQAPALIVDIIAIATDLDPDEETYLSDLKWISEWPLHAQTSAVTAIYNLTVVDYGGPKKLFGAILSQFRNLKSKGFLEA